MSDLNSTLLSILMILGCGLIVAIIIVISRLAKTVTEMHKDMTELTQTVIPLVDRINSLAQGVEQALTVVDDNRRSIAESVEYVRGMTRNVYRLQQIVVDRIEPPLLEFASLVGSVMTGVRTFTETWRRGR